MRRNILYLLSIGICLFTCVGSHAAAPETRAHLERGRSLFDHGRWTDARYELLKAREGADRDDRLTLQQIDYQLAVCALKLGSRDAEAMLADFSKRYPESVYNNDLRFAQGLLYCSRSEYDKALACFGRVNYRALDRTRREQYDLRRRYLLGELRSMGLECFEPQGAFYMFPSIESTGLSSDEFCERLLHEQEVAVIPGSAFGESGEGHVRISYSYSMNHLREACSRIRKFLQTL